MHKNTKDTMKPTDTVSTKNFDPINRDEVVIGSGGKSQDAPKIRKELVENILTLLQNTVDDKIGGVNFITKVDLVENHLYDLVTYANSLKESLSAIMDNYPSEDDEALVELIDICDILNEGVETVQNYLNAIKKFGDDLNGIKSEMYTQMTKLFQEI